MKTLKIESGKFYRTRNGHKVRIYATDGGGEYPVHGAIYLDDGVWISRTWTSNGFYSSIDDTSDSDLISEWRQTIDDIDFDKSCLPKWAKFICMNEAGQWYWSDAKPTYIRQANGLLDEYWDLSGQVSGIIPDEHAPKNYQGVWKDSLFEIAYNNKQNIH